MALDLQKKRLPGALLKLLGAMGLGSALQVLRVNAAGTGVEFATTITPWVAYTPTITGFGTAASIVCRSRRVGDSLELDGKFTSGTPTGVEARLSLGFNGVDGGINSDATKVPSIMLAGDALRGATSNISGRHTVLIESNVGYVTFGISTSTANGMTKVLGSSMVSAGDIVAFRALIPISGW